MNYAAIHQMLSEVNTVSITVRLAMALLLGGVIGIERGRKGRPAGFRTHMLVCLGAALAMMTNQYVVQTFNASDPVRLGAQVISGIGFLGAGTIIVTGRHQIRGLTTAAGLWASACMGLAIGIGFYEAAIIATCFILFVTAILHRLDEYVHSRSRIVELYVEFSELRDVSGFIEELRKKSLRVTEIEMVRTNGSSEASVAAVMTLRSAEKRDHAEVLALVSQEHGVTFVEGIQ